MQLLKQNRQEPNCFACSAVMALRHMLQIEQSPYLSIAHIEGLFEYIGHRGIHYIFMKDFRDLHPIDMKIKLY